MRMGGSKDRRATFDDVGDHNVTTKTILGARARQQVGVPHGAHHRRILEGEKKRGMRGPATRSAFWGCRACKAARDEAAKKARETRRRNGERRDWDDWKHEDSAPPQASMAHILSASCAGNKVKKINILSFALASEIGDRTQRYIRQRDCPPPPLALTAQDCVPRRRRHIAGDTTQGEGAKARFGC